MEVGKFIWYFRPFFHRNWNETCFCRKNYWLIEETGYHSWDSEPNLRLRRNLWLSPSGSQLRDPCSGPQAVYQDLSTRHDWACIKATARLVNLCPLGAQNKDLGAVVSLACSRLQDTNVQRSCASYFSLNLVFATSLLLSEILAQATASQTLLVGVRLRFRRRLQRALIWVNKG